MRIPEEKIKSMASDHWGVDALTEYHWEKVIKFGRLVEKEYERIRAIEDTRMGCMMNGGHEFALSAGGGFREIEYSSPAIMKGWTGHGTCRNCDAVLGVTYREDQ